MKLQRGSVVYMKAESGLIGYGNAQCVSWVSHELGELSLYGHNENYKIYDVAELVEEEKPSSSSSVTGESEAIGELLEALEQCLSRINPKSKDTWDLKAVFVAKKAIKKFKKSKK